MNIFFSDLDNTMIYSHRRKINTPNVVVEHLDGKEQSFMSKFSFEFFSKADWLEVVPVTTRTEQQYNRIEVASRFRFRFAIVCNGGKLLVDGKEDKEWTEETCIRTYKNFDSLEDATDILTALCSTSIIHRPEKYMVYVKCSEPEIVYEKMLGEVDLSKVSVQRDGRKVYLFANSVTKGDALERFVKKREKGSIVVAGDSLMDVSMLNKADYAFTIPDIDELITCHNKVIIKDELFSDGICKYLIEMRKNGVL